MNLGKISAVKVGEGGYQECMFGVSFTLDMGGSCVGDFWGTWSIKRSEGAKWTEEDRMRIYGETFKRLNDLMKQAKVKDVNDLVGIPIEVTLRGNTLESWRILTEVL